MPAIPSGSLILVTGGTGFIGSHVVEEALKAGFKVRVPSRTQEKGEALKANLEKLYPEHAGKIDIVVIPDGFQEGAYDDAVKGVSGIAHLATAIDFKLESWEDVVKPSIIGTQTVLKSAKKYASDSVKRVIICSSSGASGVPNPVPRSKEKETKFQKLDATTWNDGSVERASKARDEGKTAGPWDSYYASKVLAERAAWDFVKQEKPSFDVISILPNCNFGTLLPGASGASTGGFLHNFAYKGDASALKFPPQWFINVSDTAKLHIVALADERVKPNERIWAVSGRFSGRETLEVIERIKPELKGKYPAPQGDEDLVDATDIDFERVKELLEPHGGLKDFETSVRENLGITA